MTDSISTLFRNTPVENFRLQYQFYPKFAPDKTGQLAFVKVSDPAIRKVAGLNHLNKVLQHLHQQQQKHLGLFASESVSKQLTPYKGLIPGYGDTSVFDRQLLPAWL